ncbi:unnamed protein product [Prorocentrum cordatum]|uniref:Uncharacterized protein n=1 Tax=Prorocentrum cordatum TaxID=2364126 RepID=A0ABN9STL7_9DINO|nr:unnamed protein product [Polarella glacialis]
MVVQLARIMAESGGETRVPHWLAEKAKEHRGGREGLGRQEGGAERLSGRIVGLQEEWRRQRRLAGYRDKGAAATGGQPERGGRRPEVLGGGGRGQRRLASTCSG